MSERKNQRLHVNSMSTRGALEEVKRMINSFGGVEQVESIKLNTRTTASKPGKNRIPVKVRMKGDVEICTYPFVCGCVGGSSVHLIELMNFCNMDFFEDDIRNQQIITTTFYPKEPHTAYEETAPGWDMFE